MGLVFEELIRLMVSLLFIEDDEALSKPGIVRTIYDPTAGTGTGTGGMLSVAGEHLHEIQPGARLTMFGQELNPESYAICKADMLIKGQDVRSIVLGERGKQKGKPQPDSALRDAENVPLSEDVQAWFEREVLSHAPDAWIDHDKTRIGYEIPFNRHFYVFEPPRPLAEIDADLKRSMDRIKQMIEGLAG